MARQLPLLILISFDGFRHDYLSPQLTPNLYQLKPISTLGNMQSMYFTKTFPNHFSIATGWYEDEHQIINNNMFDPNLNETFKPGNHKSEWWNPSGKAMPIWIANQVIQPLGSADSEPSNRHSGVMMYPGSGNEYNGIVETHFKDYDTVRNWTQNVETVMTWILHPKTPANLVVMYFDDPDRVAHYYGPWGKETLKSLRRVDVAAGYLVKRLRDFGLFDDTNIIFLSDHGMAEIKSLIYLSDFVDTKRFRIIGTSPDWSVFVKPEFENLRSQIFDELDEASHGNHFRIYKREDIPPEWHYSKSERIGDFFILVDEGFDLYIERESETTPTTAKPKLWGNHGWKPTSQDMRPLFMAVGPSFKQNYIHDQVFPNIDVFPLMAFLLNLPQSRVPNNGSWTRITDMIDVNHFERYSGDHISASLVEQFSFFNLISTSSAGSSMMTWSFISPLLVFVISFMVLRI